MATQTSTESNNKVTLRQYVELFASTLGPQKGRVIWMFLLLLTGIGLQLMMPQLISRYIDTAETGGTVRTLSWIAGGFIAITVVNQVVHLFGTYFSENVGWSATNKLRVELALHALRLDMSFHKEHSSGAMIERVDGDVLNLANFFSKFIVHVFGNIVLLIGIIAVLFVENIWIGSVFAAFAVVAMFALHLVREFAMSHWAKARQTNAELFGFLGERMTGAEDIRANGAVPYTMRRLHQLLYKLLLVERPAHVRGHSIWPATMLLFGVGYLLVFALGFWLYGDHAITIGTIYLMFSYMENLRTPVERLSQQLQELQKAGASIRRIRQLLAIKQEIVDGPGANFPAGALEVAFDNVTFAYAQDTPVLHNLTFTLEKGKVLGLLGRTGSGKTTISRLLFRLYDPQQGAIRFGGQDIKAATLHQLRTSIGIVTQEVRLFQASVRDNITLFDRTIADEKIKAVLDDLGLGDWYRTLPNGLDTELTLGGGLSAGQAQLLSFARVFLRDPQLVILDEASSRLDPLTERLIDKAVARLLQDRTAIIIAHRLQTIQEADDILILDGGHIAEHGRREELERDPHSRYSQLLQTGLEEVLT
ncbi:MAG TPA: ABC transporter ATP-binding protein [Bacilli bacterium]|nr:ABC transporter ATP-binding protein [Bacilli bacterium]